MTLSEPNDMSEHGVSGDSDFSDGDFGVHNRRSRRFGPYVTFGTVAVVLVAACLTLFGLGAFDRAVAVYDPAAWLFSKTKGELGRVNGSTAKVDTRVKVGGTAGHRVEVSQTDRYLIVRDVDTGMVSALDLTTLQIAASVDTTPGLGVRVVVHGQTAFIVDRVHGEIRQVDPLTLNPVGAPVDFAPGLVGGEFDSDGKLWVALPGQGTVVAVSPAAKAGEAPRLETSLIAEPSHDLGVSVLDKGVSVLDQTADQLVTVRSGQVTKTGLSLDDPGEVAARTSGDQVPVTVSQNRQIYVVANATASGSPVSSFQVPGSGTTLSPAVAWAGWFYVADDTTGTVYVLDGSGKPVDQISFPSGPGALDLQVRDDYLYINAVDGSSARVVDKHHNVSTVNKYPNNVAGGDPPPAPPPTNPPPPPLGPPGAPGGVAASAGNTTAHVTWGAAPANGSPITKYVVEGAGKPITVGANQRAIDVPGLTNGTTYTFTVYAVNAKGKGPKGAANPVMPTSDVPDPPASVTAQEQKDGTVTVSWPAGNGQGHKVASYQITAIGPDGSVQAGQPDGTKTSFSVPAGTLKYGTQYAFTVTTINDKGTGSKPSPMSNTVVPYTVPDMPASLTVSTGSAKGTVHAVWRAPAFNGRPITGYLVTANGRPQTVVDTSVDLGGLGDGQSVAVSVAAVNAAGNSKAAGPQTAKTIAQPKVTLTGSSVGYNSITAHFTVDAGGASAANCSMSVGGAGNAGGNCNTITVGGLAPGTRYNFTVSVSNAAGSASAGNGATTTALWGTVGCVGGSYCNSGVGIYSQPMQDTGVATNWDGHNGKRYQAFCKVAGGKGNQQGSATLTSAQFNNNKTSNMWVKISNSPVRYVPWVWFNLDAGDNLGNLPGC
jgi:hypothetical protein